MANVESSVSSVGQSTGLMSLWSRVRAPHGASRELTKKKRETKMRFSFTMALCAWRADWPPSSDAVRMGLFQTFPELVDLSKPFCCRHLPEGPAELECYTSVQWITLSECAYYKSAMKDIPVDYIKIYPNVSNETFSLCRVDLQCTTTKENRARNGRDKIPMCDIL